MIDITDQLTAASTHADGWSSIRGLEALKEASAQSQGRIDWDSEAGEDWATLLAGDSPTTIVHLSIPVAITNDPTQAKILSCAGVHRVIVVRNFTEPSMRCSVEVLESVLLAPNTSWDSAVNPDAFSAQDLWAVTV